MKLNENMEDAAPTAHEVRTVLSPHKRSGTACIATGSCGQKCKKVQKLVIGGPMEDFSIPESEPAIGSCLGSIS